MSDAFLKSNLTLEDLVPMMESINGYVSKFINTVGAQNYRQLLLKQNISLEQIVCFYKIKQLTSDYLNPLETQNELDSKKYKFSRLNNKLEIEVKELNKPPLLASYVVLVIKMILIK